MRMRAFIPAVEGNELEDRVALSTAAVINTSIPFVFAPAGVRQNAINFTSNTFHQILDGGGGNNGLKQIFQTFSRNRNESQLDASLTKLSQRVPYGRTDLLPTWQADVAAGNFRSVQNDLITYLNDGVGTSFNVLKSHVHYSTDNLLIYNGKV
jgi:hypothetical protein